MNGLNLTGVRFPLGSLRSLLLVHNQTMRLMTLTYDPGAKVSADPRRPCCLAGNDYHDCLDYFR